jgi:hypothetical protein
MDQKSTVVSVVPMEPCAMAGCMANSAGFAITVVARLDSRVCPRVEIVSASGLNDGSAKATACGNWRVTAGIAPARYDGSSITGWLARRQPMVICSASSIW